ncbi:MAG: hypothetical protein QME49_04715 [bacterium]|nr:hypothetical protein [bacterium]
MNKIFIVLMVLLSYISLCYSEDIDREKLELSTQSEEETATHNTGENVQPEASKQGTTTYITEDPPPTTGTSSSTPAIAEEIVQGTESSTIATVSTTSQQEETRTPAPGTVSPASQQMGTESSTTGSPTLSSQPAAGTGTDDTIEVIPQGIWGKIGSWMVKFSGSSTITGSPSTTGLIFVPTAFRLDKQAKLNVDFVFTFYIGEFWNKTKEKMDIFNPINRLSCSGDFKYSFLLEKKWIPAAAFGYQGFIGLQDKASSAKEMGGAVSEKSESFGYTYAILSKRFKNIGVHIGSQSGPIGKLINPLSNKLNITSNSALIAGIDTKICKRKTFVEIIYPQGNECVMVNTFVDNFLPFNFTYIRFNNKLSNNTTKGYSLSGYFGARTSGFPGTKKKKKTSGQ